MKIVDGQSTDEQRTMRDHNIISNIMSQDHSYFRLLRCIFHLILKAQYQTPNLFKDSSFSDITFPLKLCLAIM